MREVVTQTMSKILIWMLLLRIRFIAIILIKTLILKALLWRMTKCITQLPYAFTIHTTLQNLFNTASNLTLTRRWWTLNIMFVMLTLPKWTQWFITMRAYMLTQLLLACLLAIFMLIMSTELRTKILIVQRLAMLLTNVVWFVIFLRTEWILLNRTAIVTEIREYK